MHRKELKTMYRGWFLILTCFILSCQDAHQQDQSGEPDTGILITENEPADLYIIDTSTRLADSEVDADRNTFCSSITNQDVEHYCSCQPQCCQRQQWYCPPRPDQEIHRKEVLIDICGPDMVPCMYGEDPMCPPPEIISEGDCQLAFECPPGSTGEFIEWFDCELGDGRFGRQRVYCNKGSLIHDPCQPCDEETCNGLDDDCDNRTDEGRYPCGSICGPGEGFCVDGQVVECNAPEPEEEICDFEDNDCDNDIDEGQRNACNECGAVAGEICDNIDNDCDGIIDEDLIQVCETICGSGFEFCEQGNWISCTAEQPAREECNGTDDDCDGIIDEGLNCLCGIDDIGVLLPCAEPPLLCGMGYKTCECADPPDCLTLRMTECLAICYWLPPNPNLPPDVCDQFVGIPLQDEMCNNYDDDCDQEIDEGLRRECYSADPATLGVGICLPGEQLCLLGEWGSTNENMAWTPNLCAGETVPTEEVCDGADNDCDGEVDYGEEVRETDILFVIDYSGSMDDEIEAVLIALNRFAQEFEAENELRWGLVGGPMEAGGVPHGNDQLTIISDIVPFEDFLARLAGAPRRQNTGSEMILDAVYLSLLPISGNLLHAREDLQWDGWDVEESIPPIDQFNISWRPGVDRIIIVFTDENEQSYLAPSLRPFENGSWNINAVITAATATPNLKIYTFSTNEHWLWDELAQSTGGRYYELVNNAAQMFANLMEIIDQVCLPRNIP